MSKLNVKSRTIFCKDNIDILQGINDECIDLIYLDPPFNKNKKFTAPIGSSAEGAEFSDIFREKDVKDEWVDSIKFEIPELHEYLNGVKSFKNNYNYCYLVYMSIRLIECHRTLKETGSIYLHCDSTMSHYLKVAMDCIFGEKNFRNEIIWQRNDGRGKGSQHKPKKWGANTDTILFYAKSEKVTVAPYAALNSEYDELEGVNESKAYKLEAQKEMLEDFPHYDEIRKDYYKKGIPVFCSRSMGPRPDLCYEWMGIKNPHPSGWRLSKKRLEEEHEKGNIIVKGAKIERRKYLKDYLGKPVDNNWTDIARVAGAEYIGYPTQKPLALLKRIIEASTEEGQVVLDPFCGCATTCVAAEKSNRNWIGIDVSQKAFEFVKMRLVKEVKEKLFDFDKDLGFSIDPPVKDGQGKLEAGYVYIISNKAWGKWYKVGIAKDVKRRLNSYQTSDPKRGYKLEYKILATNYKDIENTIHEEFDSNHEWVVADIKDIKKRIEELAETINQEETPDELF